MGADAYDVVNLPETLPFSEVMGIFNGRDITDGELVNLDEGKGVALTSEQILDFYYGMRETELVRREVRTPFSGFAVNLYTASGRHTYFLSSGVQIGTYGDSYLCYVPQETNEIMYSLTDSYWESGSKNDITEYPINTDSDFLKLPADLWAQEPAKTAAGYGLLPYEFTSQYQKNISREQFCILLGRLICVANNYRSLNEFMLDNGLIYLKSYFSDCSGADDSINILYALGIVSGKTETAFDPEGCVTREQAAKLICETASKFISVDLSGTPDFSDNRFVSKWAHPYVAWVSDQGLMSGIGENEFGPLENYTVQQAVATLNRLYEKIQK